MDLPLSDSIHIRPYVSEDASSVSEFMVRCFMKDLPYENRSHSPDYYAWRYRSNYCGQPVVYVAEAEKRIVGLMAVVPKLLWLDGNEVLGAESGDTFMDPSFKGKNIFMKLASRVFDDCRQANFQVIYGAPNPVSYDVVVKLFGYEELFQYRSWIRPLNFTGIIRSRLKIPVIPVLAGKTIEWLYGIPNRFYHKKSDFDMIELKEADPQIDAVWRKYRSDISYSVVKNRQYVNWRYFQSPEDFRVFLLFKNGSPEGYVVFKLISLAGLICGHIVDLFCPEYAQNPVLWTHILRTARVLKADFVNTWIALHRHSFRPMKKTGFIQRRKPFWLVMRGEHQSVSSFKGIKDVSNWCFSQADTDNI